MLETDVLPVFSRTLGKLCAQRRIADTLLSDLEGNKPLDYSRDRLQCVIDKDMFGEDLSLETKDNMMLELLGDKYRKDAMRAYDAELQRFVKEMNNIVCSKDDPNAGGG